MSRRPSCRPPTPPRRLRPCRPRRSSLGIPDGIACPGLETLDRAGLDPAPRAFLQYSDLDPRSRRAEHAHAPPFRDREGDPEILTGPMTKLRVRGDDDGAVRRQGRAQAGPPQPE